MPEKPEDALQGEAGGTAYDIANTFHDQRQRSRLPDGFVLENRAVPFDPRIAYELALEIDDPADVFARFGLTDDEGLRLLSLPVFQETVRRFHTEIKDNGLGFRTKARVIAEEVLDHAHEIATDSEKPAAVRADLIKWFAKVGDLEPTPKKPDNAAETAQRYQFQIIFSGNQPAQTMTIEQRQPLTIEGE